MWDKDFVFRHSLSFFLPFCQPSEAVTPHQKHFSLLASLMMKVERATTLKVPFESLKLGARLYQQISVLSH